VLETDELITIKTDTLSATSEVVSALAQGQSECFYIGGQLTLSPSRERFEGFKQGIEKAGIEFQSRYIYTKDYQPESGYQMMDKLVQDLGRFPRAIFTASYSLLEGVLKYLNDHNALSTKIRVATFDNYAILDCLPIKIDSVEQDCQSIAQTMFEAGKSVVDNVTFPDKHRQVDAIVRVRR
jgi:LacI family sucrose operon transcriptional repressor